MRYVGYLMSLLTLMIRSILDKQEGEIPLSPEEKQQLSAYNKKIENYQQLGVLLDVMASGLSSPTSDREV